MCVKDVTSFITVVDDGLVSQLVLVNFAMWFNRIGEAELDAIDGDVLTGEEYVSVHLTTDTGQQVVSRVAAGRAPISSFGSKELSSTCTCTQTARARE